MSLALMQNKVTEFNNAKTDQVEQRVNACVPAPPEFTEEHKQQWVQKVTDAIAEAATKGETSLYVRLANGRTESYNFDRDGKLGARQRPAVEGFDSSATSAKEGMFECESHLTPHGLRFWLTDVNIRITQVRRSDIKIRQAAVEQARERRDHFLQKAVDDLIEYWSTHSDIPVKSVFCNMEPCLTFDWTPSIPPPSYEEQRAAEQVNKYRKKLRAAEDLRQSLQRKRLKSDT